MLFAPAGSGFVPEGMGLDPVLAHRLRFVPFNDLVALTAALDKNDVACVVTESALTTIEVV
jgi:glutamate-1-semialdehyde aminotransferase